MKLKFKIGDIVRCTAVVDGNKRVLNERGSIRAIGHDEALVEFNKDIGGHDGQPFVGGTSCKDGHGWWCEFDKLEFLKGHTIVIYRDDNKVIALDKSTGKKAVARCNPADKFDFNTGAKLAFERLTRNVTFRVLCVRDTSRMHPLGVKGHIYEFVDGVTTWNTGKISRYYENFKGFIYRNDGWDKCFIELKEDDEPGKYLKSMMRVLT